MSVCYRTYVGPPPLRYGLCGAGVRHQSCGRDWTVSEAGRLRIERQGRPVYVGRTVLVHPASCLIKPLRRADSDVRFAWCIHSDLGNPTPGELAGRLQDHGMVARCQGLVGALPHPRHGNRLPGRAGVPTAARYASVPTHRCRCAEAARTRKARAAPRKAAPGYDAIMDLSRAQQTHLYRHCQRPDCWQRAPGS